MTNDPSGGLAALTALCFQGVEAPVQVHNARGRISTPSGSIESKTVPGGHVGLFITHRTVGDTWPGIAKWMRHNGPTTEGQ